VCHSHFEPVSLAQRLPVATIKAHPGHTPRVWCELILREGFGVQGSGFLGSGFGVWVSAGIERRPRQEKNAATDFLTENVNSELKKIVGPRSRQKPATFQFVIKTRNLSICHDLGRYHGVTFGIQIMRKLATLRFVWSSR